MKAKTERHSPGARLRKRLGVRLSRNGKQAASCLTGNNSRFEKGLETLQKVHSLSLEVPIIVLTGLDDDAVGVQTVQLGAQDYLVKGHFDGSLLVRSLRYAIERKRTENTSVSSDSVWRFIKRSARRLRPPWTSGIPWTS
jgi:FixJ family two-component response regulator